MNGDELWIWCAKIDGEERMIVAERKGIGPWPLFGSRADVDQFESDAKRVAAQASATAYLVKYLRAPLDA